MRILKLFIMTQLKNIPKLKTRLPITTIKESLEYKPENYVSSIKAPILVIGADQDIVCPVEESKILYKKANEPKELFIIEGAKHYDVYEGENFQTVLQKSSLSGITGI